ncbi:MAG TPA: trigger factor, partial [Blastocatellia bacterium]|nr:trigger factor [Blastocatellia bacterium]
IVKKPKVREDEVDKVIAQLRDRHAELVPVEDRGAQPGDIVTVNLTGTLSAKPQKAAEEPAKEETAAEGQQATSEEAKPEGEAEATDAAQPEGEQASEQTGEKTAKQEPGGPEEINQKDLEIELGAEGVLKEFTEALTGSRAGEERTITVHYPEDFSTPHYAGRTAELKAEVTAVKVKELPELDDEFAQSINEDFKTVEDLRADVRNRLQKERDHSAEEAVRAAVRQRMLDRYKFDVPQAAVERRMDALFEQFAEQLYMNRIDPTRLNLDWAGIRESSRERAEHEVRWAFILDSIGNFQKTAVSDEELRQEVERMAEAMGQQPAALRARLNKEGLLDNIREQIKNRKVLGFIVAAADAKIEEVESLETEPGAGAEGEEQAGEKDEAAQGASEASAE